MKSIRNILLISLLIAAIPVVQAQRILLVEKPGKFKNYKYFIGSDITLRTLPYSTKHSGVIHDITDTSIVINFDNEIMIEEIEKIMKPRWGIGLLSMATRIAGAGYFLLDVTNNIITGQPTIVDQNTVIISGSLVAFSYALVPLRNKQLKRGDKWRIKILNMSMDDEVPNPFQR